MTNTQDTTPARAEAQDEGAAGEREKWIEDARDFAERMISQPAACEIIERLLMIIQAHPSPTPAADADRVRIAVEALERIAEEAPFRSGYSQSDVEYGPTLSIDEMQSVARAALSHMKPE